MWQPSLARSTHPHPPRSDYAPLSVTLVSRWRAATLPVVRFLNGREEAMTPKRFGSEVPGLGTATREQVLVDDGGGAALSCVGAGVPPLPPQTVCLQCLAQSSLCVGGAG